MRTGLLCLTISFFACGAAFAQEDEDVSPYKEMKTLARAIELVRQDYVDEDKTAYEDLAYNALRGMLAELDPHSDFMDPKDFKGMQEDTKSEFGGLGVVVGMKNDRLTIVAPMEGTPGFRAGLLPGDVILEIDGQSAEKMTLRDAVDKLRGDPGTAVEIAVAREKEPEPMKFTMEREVIKVPSVCGARVLDTGTGPRIGYVRVTQFSEPTGKEFARALADLEKQDMDALVLDLRFNPGGLLTAAVDVAGEFMPSGSLVAYTEGRSAAAERRYLAPGKGHKARSYPVAVLINGSSASGAEIVAGALKDTGRALLVGEKTFGKGSVQSVISLPDGSAVRLTTAKYYTPGKQLIHEKGVVPHIRATMSSDDEARLLALRRQDDLPEGTKKEELGEVEDMLLLRAVDALRGVLLHAREGTGNAPSKEG
jgi:carboxyl-terminal processing protease